MAQDHRVKLGRITTVYGVKGWVKVFSSTEPMQNIFDYQPWQTCIDGVWQDLKISQGKTHGKGLIALLEGCEDRDQARKYCGLDISVDRAILPNLEDGDYYWQQLTGLNVETDAGVKLGKVDHLIATGSNDVLVVKVVGGVAEIGGHHGKSFAALALLNLDAAAGGDDEHAHRAVAIDVFDDQLLNTDGSGEGDLETFRSTVRMWCGEDCLEPSRLSVLQQDSLALTAAQVIAESGGARPRIFSIDGSHTAEHTEADIRTAAGSICEVTCPSLHRRVQPMAWQRLRSPRPCPRPLAA